MIEVIAKQRMGRALHSKTRKAVQLEERHVGEKKGELYRAPCQQGGVWMARTHHHCSCRGGWHHPY
eukprot:7934385-Prorocentrum_lima.AAC.1